MMMMFIFTLKAILASVVLAPTRVNFVALPERGGRGLPVSVQEK